MSSASAGISLGIRGRMATWFMLGAVGIVLVSAAVVYVTGLVSIQNTLGQTYCQIASRVTGQFESHFTQKTSLIRNIAIDVLTAEAVIENNNKYRNRPEKWVETRLNRQEREWLQTTDAKLRKEYFHPQLSERLSILAGLEGELIRKLSVYDMHGVLIGSTATTGHRVLRDQAWYRSVLDKDDHYTYLDIDTTDNILKVVMPVWGGVDIAGYVYGELDFQLFTRDVLSLRFGQTGQAVVVDYAGVPLLGKPESFLITAMSEKKPSNIIPSENFVPGQEPYWVSIATGRRGGFWDRLVCVAPIAHLNELRDVFSLSPWSIVVTQSPDESYAGLKKSLGSFAIAGFFGVILVGFAGGETIHAKRIPGRFRSLKWIGMSTWLAFFLGPYIRWNDNQAILFDIPNRQFHLFSLTIHPQDVWLLSLILIFMAMMLFGVTAIAGRVFCGYFCFQTVWTDVFTWIEEKTEGNPAQRRKLDKAALSFDKLKKKLIKHSLWLLISMLTGITFAAYFTDAFQLWHDYFTLQAHSIAYVVLAAFILGTYFLAGYLREQTCLWLCPYARIQGVMYDKDTILPTYDEKRGEPRGKLKSGSNTGDCIDCHMCVAVCPTGVDIRNGQQEGCITCGMCIDACDSIMEKINRPTGLIRYASYKEMAGVHIPPLFKRPRVIIYALIMLLSLSGIIYGLGNIAAVEWHILHQRQPLYTMMSDGSVQNKYTFKILNKTKADMNVSITTAGIDDVALTGISENMVLKADKLVPFSVFLRADPDHLKQERTTITFIMTNLNQPDMVFKTDSVVVRPPH